MAETQERTFGGLSIRIEREKCIGSGNCVKVAPELFELDDSNLVTFVNEARVDDRERAVEACAVCPVDALVVTQDGKQIV